MVVALGPGKFYGSSLPRPRFYADVKFNEERVDPPVTVLDPLMSWAEEAHWSMGGLSFKRLRLQGRIEGRVDKLRKEREKIQKKRAARDQIGGSGKDLVDGDEEEKDLSPPPPPAPMAVKRRRFVALIDEDEDDDLDEQADEAVVGKRGPARKLGDDFDRVAEESGLGKKRGSPAKVSEAVASRTRGRKASEESADSGTKLKRGAKGKRGSENGESSPAGRTRASPRLAKRGLR
ncbi:uncharacterized protein LOC127811782 [Diospyros lotus]|uniref:uncharacterized protein LOC127811782 n=1 Tax=Diospyros lotus TaxID=55363 RepID=UPI0022518FD1|nr:uncharacterized protein LOC127811782 [Diospyros lotus]